jgi:NAD(P)-dependent dehydrogenase (short-subunit alcohol dehydrogenase family)
LDVSDGASMDALIAHCDAIAPLDLCIANAGIVGGDDATCVRTNFLGLVHTLTPATKHMKRRGYGQLVVMSSLGGHAPTTNRYMTAYNATKAAANSYGLGLRACLAEAGIGVTVVCPGFVRSRMTDGLAKQGVRFYGLWPTERACAAIEEGVALNEPEVAFPMALNVITRLLGAMPPWLKEIALPTLVSGDPFAVMDKAKVL